MTELVRGQAGGGVISVKGTPLKTGGPSRVEIRKIEGLGVCMVFGAT